MTSGCYSSRFFGSFSAWRITMGNSHAELGREAPTAPESQWGARVADARANWLQSRLEAQRLAQPGKSASPGPFERETLTGADVFWLAAHALAGPGGDFAAAETRLLAAQGNPLLQVSLDLSRVDLRRAVLSGAYLEGATLGRVRLEGATLGAAHLQGAFLGEAHL